MVSNYFGIDETPDVEPLGSKLRHDGVWDVDDSGSSSLYPRLSYQATDEGEYTCGRIVFNDASDSWH